MLRAATDDDLVALTDLERAANLVGLRHVFPPEQFPFPDDDVLARWALVLQDPDVVVLVEDGADGDLDVFAAYDSRTLRHLAVHPSRWGGGVATRAVRAVLAAMAARGATSADLWCLELNHRARGLYEHLGWAATDDRREAPWPPHPVEMRYSRPIAASDR